MISIIHSFIQCIGLEKVTYTSIYTIYNNISSRCVVRSSIELNKQANIRLEKNRWHRTIRLSFLFWIYMCCYCIILSRTRSYKTVYNMSVWCLKWTLCWRVRASTISWILSLCYYSMVMSDTLTLALFIFIHSFIH